MRMLAESASHQRVLLRRAATNLPAGPGCMAETAPRTSWAVGQSSIVRETLPPAAPRRRSAAALYDVFLSQPPSGVVRGKYLVLSHPLLGV